MIMSVLLAQSMYYQAGHECLNADCDDRLTIDLLEHAAHVFEVAVVQEPDLWIPIVLLIRDCTASRSALCLDTRLDVPQR